MKKRVCLLVTLLALVIMGFTMNVMNVEAAEIIDRGYCGGEGDGTNLTWTLDSDGVLVIEGQGRMRDWSWEDSNYQYADWDEHTEDIYSVIIRKGVISIGSSAFWGCKSLNNIVLPESLASIGDGAFEYCVNLSSIKLPKSLTSIGDSAFSCCESLNSIDLPESLTSIGGSAFSYCYSINSIVLPKSITSIGDEAFSGCGNLSSIVLPKSIISIGDEAFSGCDSLSSIDLPESLTSIGDGAFEYCANLSSINLPESLTNIGFFVFYNCSSLSNIVIPESITSIGNYMFYCCDNLNSIALPKSLISIEDWAFGYCYSLSSINLPESLTSIGGWAFSGCTTLGSINLPESLASIGEGAFKHCANLSNINLPESLTSMGDHAFVDCVSLRSIILPKSLRSIGDSAFANCTNLSRISLPKMLISIGKTAFENCHKLSNIVLPESIVGIGERAFNNCNNLGSIYIPVSVDTIYRNTFAYAQLKDIYYGGTKEQWDNIHMIRGDSKQADYDVILEDIGYDVLRNATMHYADDDYEKLNVFVSCLYRNFLKREPDERGLADWVDVLRFGKGTGAKVVSGFVLSPEYKANSLSNEEYISALYRVIFEREPDAAGLNSWLAVMENGYTYKKVLAGFINSVEFENLCGELGIARGSYKSDEAIDQIISFVARLYKVCLGRAYDQDGLKNWVRALTSGSADVYSVVEDFFNSQEFKNRNLDDEAFVTIAYMTILDREPDEAGLEYWVNNLACGYTRDDVLYGFLHSSEFKLLCREYGIMVI